MKTNVIYNEDCLIGMGRIPDESIDLIVTDPPYKVTSRGHGGNSGGMLQKKITNKGNIFKHNDTDITVWIHDLYRVLKESGHCYIMTNNKNITHYLKVIDKSNFHFVKSLIWVKNNKIMGQSYMSQFEYILFLRKGAHKIINKPGTPDVLKYDNIKTKGGDGKNLHDTEKPVDLMMKLIENSSNKGDTVLDPFLGVGSTAIAASVLDRQYIGFELDKKYYKLAQERIKNHVIQDTLF